MPLSAFLGLYFRSYAAPGSLYLGFFLIPLIELVCKPKHNNFDVVTKQDRSKSLWFDALLYFNVPVLVVLLGFFYYILKNQNYSNGEWLGMCINMGIILAVLGINVAHELGHRSGFWPYAFAQFLLLPCLYMHFTEQHNYGHHKYVGTDQDSSTAKLNEPVYTFWWRSIKAVFINSWNLEAKRLAERNRNPFHWQNRIFWQWTFQMIYLGAVFLYAGALALVSAFVIALISILILESINYIEHYGLVRKKTLDGRYENVSEHHSWNSDHDLGRIFLYELTRHPSHHLMAHEKYQNLDSIREAPQLPFGYPATLLMALVPPLWFSVMNKRVPE